MTKQTNSMTEWAVQAGTSAPAAWTHKQYHPLPDGQIPPSVQRVAHGLHILHDPETGQTIVTPTTSATWEHTNPVVGHDVYLDKQGRAVMRLPVTRRMLAARLAQADSLWDSLD